MDMFSMFENFNENGKGETAGAAGEGFGSLSDFFKEPEKEVKKPEKKTKPAAAGKKKTAGKEDSDVTMPCTVYARGFTKTMDGNGTKKLSEILDTLHKEGYREVALSSVKAAAVGSMVFIGSPSLPVEEDTLVPEGTIVSDGERRLEVSAEAFGCDEDEISAAEVIKRWVENNPEYAGCSLEVTDKSASPVIKEQGAEKDVDYPVNIYSCGVERAFEEESAEDGLQGIAKGLFGEVPGVTVTLRPNGSRSMYFVQIGISKGASCHGSSAGTPRKKAVKKYNLPLKVIVATWGGEYQLSPEDFGGKTKVSLDDVKAHLAKSFKIFADTSRNIAEMYVSELNTLSLMFISGKKGAAPAMAMQRMHVREERLPHGIFRAYMQGDRIRFIDYERLLPKIPTRVFTEALGIFREHMDKEAAVKVCYEDGEYFLIDMTGDAGKYRMDTRMPVEMLKSRAVQVMEIHSHNTMAAFWSSVDDADEIYPGLYMVVGNIDRAMPSCLVRAGMEGVFRPLKLSDVFTVN